MAMNRKSIFAVSLIVIKKHEKTEEKIRRENRRRLQKKSESKVRLLDERTREIFQRQVPK